MSTLAEIEAATADLSPEEMAKLETFVREKREAAEEAHLQELYRINGVHPLPRRSNVVITNEMINQLREEMDI